ncbi:MAG: hypothetical protein RLY93_19000 [Sumerlaeia bacterium]
MISISSCLHALLVPSTGTHNQLRGRARDLGASVLPTTMTLPLAGTFTLDEIAYPDSVWVTVSDVDTSAVLWSGVPDFGAQGAAGQHRVTW